MRNLWRWTGALLVGVAIVTTAGIYTVFPASSLVFVALGSVGGYLFAKDGR